MFDYTLSTSQPSQIVGCSNAHILVAMVSGAVKSVGVRNFSFLLIDNSDGRIVALIHDLSVYNGYQWPNILDPILRDVE